jgi:outer membrane protein
MRIFIRLRTSNYSFFSGFADRDAERLLARLRRYSKLKLELSAPDAKVKLIPKVYIFNVKNDAGATEFELTLKNKGASATGAESSSFSLLQRRRRTRTRSHNSNVQTSAASRRLAAHRAAKPQERIWDLLSLIFMVGALLPGTVFGQARLSQNAEILTLEGAIEQALTHNRLLKNDALDVEIAADRVALARIRRLPRFEVEGLGLQTLTPVEFRFDAGSLGSLPGGALFPLNDVRIRSSRQPNAILSARITQPLSQLPRINLGVRLEQAQEQLAAAKHAAARRSVAHQVKRAYYALLQTESSLAALNESLKLHRELDRVVGDYVVQKVALASDSLDVKTRLATDEYEAVRLRNAMASQKEQLNLLLGRDVRAEFNVAPVIERSIAELDLDLAQQRALTERSEIREARLRLEQTGYQRRLKQLERWPDVSLTAGYFSPLGFAVLPVNVAAVGVSVKWEPFDWGRRKREVAVAQKSATQADAALREAEAQVALDVSARFRKLEETRAYLRVAQAAQHSAREKLRVATNKFKYETTLLKDVLQSQTAMAEADREQQQALLAFLSARADFEKAIGE